MLSEAITVALIVTIPASIISLVGAIISWVNGKKVQTLHLMLDGSLSEFKQLISKSAYAEGVKATNEQAAAEKVIFDKGVQSTLKL